MSLVLVNRKEILFFKSLFRREKKLKVTSNQLKTLTVKDTLEGKLKWNLFFFLLLPFK